MSALSLLGINRYRWILLKLGKELIKWNSKNILNNINEFYKKICDNKIYGINEWIQKLIVYII